MLGINSCGVGIFKQPHTFVPLFSCHISACQQFQRTWSEWQAHDFSSFIYLDSLKIVGMMKGCSRSTPWEIESPAQLNHCQSCQRSAAKKLPSQLCIFLGEEVISLWVSGRGKDNEAMLKPCSFSLRVLLSCLCPTVLPHCDHTRYSPTCFSLPSAAPLSRLTGTLCNIPVPTR